MLAIKNLTKTYRATGGRVDALANLCLEVEPGELLAVVGPSGCGKTTLLRCIAGLETPDTGEIALGGRDITQLPPGERNIAMAFQEPGLYPNLNVRENLAFPLRRAKHAGNDIEKAIVRMAELLRIGDLLDRQPNQLSGGQRQRVALARAIIRQPACLLLDEPLSNLESSLRRELRAEIKRVQSGLDIPMLFVTHDSEEALSMGDRVAVMRDGALQQVGPPQQVYQRPANRVVAKALGHPPMNMLNASVSMNGTATVLTLADCQWMPPPEIVERLAKYDAATIQLGFRPQDVAVAQSPEEGALQLEASVSGAQWLGDRQEASLRLTDGQQLCVVVDASQCIAANPRVSIATAAIHLFSTNGAGERLSD